MSEFKKYSDYDEWMKRVKEHGATHFVLVANGKVAQNKEGAAVGLWNPKKQEGVIYP